MMTREEVMKDLEIIADCDDLSVDAKQAIGRLSQNDQAQRAVIDRYREQVDEQAADIIGHIDEKHKLNKQTEQQAKEIGELRERIDRQATTITEYQAENETLREALRNIIECEDQWTRHDMVREAKHALKEVTT